MNTNTAPQRPSSIDFLDKNGLEHFQFYFRQHWARMFWPFLRTVLLTLLIGLITWYTFIIVGIESSGSRRLTAAFFAVCLLLVQFWFLARFYRYFLHVAVITDKRVHRIRKSLLTYDEHESIDLWMLQDVRKHQRGPLQNTFGFGTIFLESADMQMRLHFVPHINERYADLLRLLEVARNQRIAATPPAPNEVQVK